MRISNLICGKFCIELQAQKRTGEIVAVDRQTSVAVDIAEQTAAKSALQKAADEIASHMIPALAK